MNLSETSTYVKENGERNGRDVKQYLNQGEDDEMEVEGYRSSRSHKVLCWFCIVITLGILRLVFYWLPRLHLKFTHKRCSLRDATKVLITEIYENHKTYYVKNIIQGCLFDDRKRSNIGYGNNVLRNKETLDYLEEKLPTISVHFNNGYSQEMSEYRLFMVKKLRYVWAEEWGKFLKLSGLGSGMNNIDFHQHPHLTSSLQQHLMKLYGRNEIRINVQSYLTLFFIEILSPYYFFQLFSIIIWIADSYYYYTYAILIVTALGILIIVIQTHRAQITLRQTVESSEATKAEVMYAGDRLEEISHLDLVPGDRIVIPDNEEYTVPCDAVILTGACIVQESMLTGESIPLTKTALPASDESFSERESSNHLLFNGTKVIQTRREEGKRVVALVLRTGFSTAKGDLVRAILYPPPVDYAFEQSVYSFINISAIGAFALSVGTVVWLIMRKAPGVQVFAKSFELLTMVIPAAIPGSLSLGKVYAIQRFRNEKIACINPKVINVAGSTNSVCFDKTGTITEDGLDVMGIAPVINASFRRQNNTPSSLENNSLKFALATCHSLSINQNKIITGDPLDTKMFESTGWLFEEVTINDSSGYYSGPVVYPNPTEKDQMSIRFMHQCQFVSSLQRMSVVTQRSDSDSFHLYSKGSPEMIASLSLPQTVPTDLDEVLEEYTKKGYRVLALACRQLDNIPLDVIKKQSRTELETALEFLGLLILENKVKPASKPTIDLLKKGHFKITMITGDNIQTAICVSRECKIIEPEEELIELNERDGKLICTLSQGLNQPKDRHAYSEKDIRRLEEGLNNRPYKLALTGKAWEVVRKDYEDYIPQILVKAAVFARMSSRQKQQVVTEMQALGYCVVMCGDGANDCAALKAANVGVSLSQAEASVASPLSSAQEDISCIPAVVREGRASLVASFGLMKLILCYGYLQLCSVLISYGYKATLSSFEFIWEDIFEVIIFSIFFALTGAYKGEIVPETPDTKMISFFPILSLFLNMLVFIAFQFVMFFWVQTYPWYKSGPVEQSLKQPDDYMIWYNYRNYALYSISVYQTIIAGIIFSKGYPYRKPLYTNYLFVISLIVSAILTGFLTTKPGLWVQELFVIALPPMSFRYIILAMVAVNLVVSYIMENFIIEYLIRKVIMNSPSVKKKTKKNKYEVIEQKTKGAEWLSKLVDSYK